MEACLREFQTFPKGKQQQFYMLLSEFMAFLLTVPIFEDTNCISIYEALLECVKKLVFSFNNELKINVFLATNGQV